MNSDGCVSELVSAFSNYMTLDSYSIVLIIKCLYQKNETEQLFHRVSEEKLTKYLAKMSGT